MSSSNVAEWTTLPRYAVHDVLMPYLRHLVDNDRASRLTWNEIFLGMFLDMEGVSILPSRGANQSTPFAGSPGVPLNVVQPAVETAESRISQARPRPFFKGVGADPRLRRKAKNLQKFVDGTFDKVKAYPVGAQLLKDAAIFGTAAYKSILVNGKPQLERLLAAEVLVDDSLGMGTRPFEQGEVREVSRAALAAAFPKKATEIAALSGVDSAAPTAFYDLVNVYEWTRLPNGKQKGRKVIVIQGATLSDDEYAKDYFDIGILRWSNHPTSFFGVGIPQMLMAIQTSINKQVRAVEQNLFLHNNPRMLLPEQGNIVPAQLRSVPGTVLRVQKGLEPTLWVTQIMPPEVYAWIENMARKANDRIGISAATMGAKKEPGIDSGKGLEELSELQSDRLASVSMRYEEMYLDMATRLIDTIEQAFEQDPDFSIVAKDRSKAEKMFWKDIRMPRDTYEVELLAANFISRTPGAAFTDIERLLKMGIIDDPADAAEMLDFPDIKRALGDKTAAKEVLEQQIEDIYEHGQDAYVSPNPYGGASGLQLGLKVYYDAYCRAQLDDVPQDRVDLIQQYMDECLALLKSLEPPPAPPAPPMAPPTQAPMGAPN